MKLPNNLRDKLKEPFGKLIKENETTKQTISKFCSSDNFLITVGDATTEKMINYKIIPNIQIVDNQEKRVVKETPMNFEVKTELKCINPPGEVTDDAITKIKLALNSEPPVRILVEGEEDLLVLPVCLYGPDNAVIMYGQPHTGLVIINLDEETRNRAKSILDSMI